MSNPAQSDTPLATTKQGQFIAVDQARDYLAADCRDGGCGGECHG